jgi:hypothetical protein
MTVSSGPPSDGRVCEPSCPPEKLRLGPPPSTHSADRSYSGGRAGRGPGTAPPRPADRLLHKVAGRTARPLSSQSLRARCLSPGAPPRSTAVNRRLLPKGGACKPSCPPEKLRLGPPSLPHSADRSYTGVEPVVLPAQPAPQIGPAIKRCGPNCSRPLSSQPPRARCLRP